MDDSLPYRNARGTSAPEPHSIEPEVRRAARNALIALDRCGTLKRSDSCRYALELDRWWEGPPVLGRHHRPALPELTPSQLRSARIAVSRGLAGVAVEEQKARDHDARLVTLVDHDYPPELFDLELPPPVLAMRGELPTTPSVAVVGPRNADRWALRAASDFALALTQRGLGVVSGFARGVDIAAHRAAVEEPAGRTVAVLGCGLGVPYPRQHHHVLDQIAARGAVVTEFPIGKPPRAWHFPIRNRLIAALSAATLVIQASSRSGSLITAREAAELGRDVLCLPGRLEDRRCVGSNRLLRDGAHLVLGPDDVIDALPLYLRERLSRANADPGTSSSEQALRDPLLLALQDGADNVELLSERLGCATSQLLAQLQLLELDGSVESIGGGQWRLTR